MSVIQILFFLNAVVTLGAAIMVVITRNLIHAALWLIVSLFGVAISFVLLDAAFLAVVQVVIYIGAIAILMIFAIMLTRRVTQMSGGRFNANWIWALIIGIFLFVSIGWILSSWSGINTTLPELNARTNSIKDLGVALVSQNGYVIPFEVASILLLAALIGSILVAREHK